MTDVFEQFLEFGYEYQKLFASTLNHVYSSLLGMNVDNRVMTTGKTHQVSTEDRLLIFGHQCGPSRYVKLAGLSGAMAVAFAAYGAHFGLILTLFEFNFFN